jgi:hypothetical protein
LLCLSFLLTFFLTLVISAGGLTTSFTAAATATAGPKPKSGEMGVFDSQAYIHAVGVALAGLMGGAVLL